MVVWEVHKAVMRGSLIARISGKRKEKTREVEGLQNTIQALEAETSYGMSCTLLIRQH